MSPYHQIQELVAKKEPYDRLWKNVVEFNTLYDVWMNGPLLEVNAEDVDEKVSFCSHNFNDRKIVAKSKRNYTMFTCQMFLKQK